MKTINPRSGRNESEGVHQTNSRPRVERSVRHNSRQIFQLRNNMATRGPGAVGEGYQKLRHRLISRGIPESIVDELFEQPTLVNYGRGAFIFFQGGPTDLLFWVSSGLVDILCPGPNGEQMIGSVLGPGDFFGFVECKDHKGRSAQAFQARARTNVQIGLV